MADPAKKPISTRLPMDAYQDFTARAQRLGYTDTTFGEILLQYGLPRWEVAVDEHVQRIKREDSGPAKPALADPNAGAEGAEPIAPP
jgi:hypothetical protein